MQQAEKSIRVRNAGEDLLPRPGSALALLGAGLDPRSCALGMRAARSQHCGRRGRGVFAQSFRTPLSGETDEQTTGFPRPDKQSGR